MVVVDRSSHHGNNRWIHVTDIVLSVLGDDDGNNIYICKSTTERVIGYSVTPYLKKKENQKDSFAFRRISFCS